MTQTQIKKDSKNLYYEKYEGPKANEYVDLKVEGDVWWNHWMIEACRLYKQGKTLEEIKNTLKEKTMIGEDVFNNFQKDPKFFLEKYKKFLK